MLARMSLQFLRSLSLAALLVPAWTFAAEPFPEPYNSEPDQNAHPPTAEEAHKMFELPEGFQATLFASEPEVRNPIAMAWDWKGRMWVAENYTYAERATRFDLSLRDRVVVFEDSDWDGKADKRTVFAEDLQMLTSVEVGRGGVWVMCPPQVLFIPDEDEDLVPDGPAEVVLDGFTVAESNYHNFANGLRWGMDGWLYGRCGHSCPGNVGKPGTSEEERIPIEGGMWRYHPKMERFEVLTHGTTNPWGHDWDQHGELFFINTVNGHLWHGIHGAHFKESFGADPNPGVFERLDMHADHWHFDTSGKWQDSRGGQANQYGGGHAHIGMMIYQADQWPEPYRNRLFTLNMHGFRANVERLERHGSGYIGRHQDDVFLMGDPWFRGIDIQQGPDGSAYILDWSDTGECHEHTGVHRTSGRIYRISYGTPQKPDFTDLNQVADSNAKVSSPAIRRLIETPNVWFDRQMQSRAYTLSRDSAPPHLETALLEAFLTATDPVVKLRAFWTLQSVSPGVEAEALLSHENEHLRAAAIRALVDAHPIDTILGPQQAPKALPSDAFSTFLGMAKSDKSGLVRLTLASALQRISLEQRAQLGARLVAHADDAEDHNLPSMVWYGLIPLTDSNPMSLVEVARACQWPDTLQWMARSLAGQLEEDTKPIDALLSMAQSGEPWQQMSVLQGISDGLQGWRKAPKPEAWDAFVSALPEDQGQELAGLTRDLSALFGDGRALDSIKKVALDPNADLTMRQAALNTLIDNQPPDLREICEKLLDQRHINTIAVRGLSTFDDPKLGAQLAKNYRRFYPAERPALMETLVSRPAWAAAMLQEMKAGRIAKTDLSAFHARQIRAFEDADLTASLADIWGEVRESSADKRQMIEEWTAKLTSDYLADANLSNGRVLFQGICGACHVMYGQGGNIGPDLTGSNRANLDYLLENVLDPSAVVSADYQMSLLTLADGRVLTGVVANETDRTLTLRLATGELTVEKSEITKREVSKASMMPEGLFLAFQPDQVRDLIAYLKHPVQVPLPGAE